MVTQIPSDAARRIAWLCQFIDDKWYKSVDSDSECQKHLDELTEETVECGALVFPQVRFRWMVSDREEVSLRCIAFIANQAISESVRASCNVHTDAICSLAERKADFYLLYDGRILHCQMSSKSSKIVELEAPEKPLIWDISSSTMRKMVKKLWNRSFIMANSLGQVIPLPDRPKEEEGVS